MNAQDSSGPASCLRLTASGCSQQGAAAAAAALAGATAATNSAADAGRDTVMLR